MKECPQCQRCFPDHTNFCPDDGEATTASIAGEPLLDGRYELEQRLGQGSMGVVFRARHIFLKTTHAIKVILPDLVGNDPMLVTRFRQEAMAAAAIRHPNIIAVTDFGVMRGTMPFLVMEFVDGKSLHDVLAKEGSMLPKRAFELISAIGAGLAAAHKQGIVHRDLKPRNIMIQANRPFAEGLKILDFGLAKIKSGELLGSFVQAKTSGSMGSPFYMAPELWEDEERDARADIYSLGVILYQMLAGDVPFKGSSIPKIMKQHLTSPPPSFQSMGVNVPQQIDAVVRYALEKEVDERVPTVEDFINELRIAVESTAPTRQNLRDNVSIHFNRTMSSQAPAAPPEPAGTIPDSDFGNVSNSSIELELSEQEARERIAREELSREFAARRLAEAEASRKRAEEEQRLRQEIEERERRQREQLGRVARQEREFDERTAWLDAGLPPQTASFDPEVTRVTRPAPMQRQPQSGRVTTAKVAKQLDENVQFTVFRPRAVAPEKLYSLLVYAHLSERRPGAPLSSPHPKADLERRAREALGEKYHAYEDALIDSRQAIPQEGMLTFLPVLEGFEFFPAHHVLFWDERPLQELEFKMKASRALEGQTARGYLRVYLGIILVAEVSLAILVDTQKALEYGEDPSVTENPIAYRKIFASYSHKDEPVVEQFEQLVEAFGDKYLRDVRDIRAGEKWEARLEKLISDADIFQLFWSKNSMRSEFVQAEWKYALSLNKPNFIRPTFWEEPMPEDKGAGLPPEALRRLQFKRVPVFGERLTVFWSKRERPARRDSATDHEFRVPAAYQAMRPEPIPAAEADTGRLAPMPHRPQIIGVLIVPLILALIGFLIWYLSR